MMNWVIALVLALAVPQVAVQGTQGLTSPVDPTAYKIGVDDELKIEVFSEEELTGSFRVDSEGTISYPFLGRLPVAGLTVQEIGQLIQVRLAAGWINNPQVSVGVEQFKSRHIFILGEVKQAGKYALQGEVTLLEIIALAGSVNATAGDEIVVVRPKDNAGDAALTPDNPSGNVLTRIYLSDLRSGKQVGNIMLENGDTIYVPAAERVFVSGHVKNPSAIVWKRGMTVEQAITLAGGVTERGTLRRLAIRRGSREFGVKREDLVQPNDMVIVKMRFF
ncbi:MAG TPA: polysaccharide biosynthesis/export family protein [Vicinamibacterales bacterium]|nr:polysaccharide biosynthesis/export family protein [Vicinamibacterales bacterium]